MLGYIPWPEADLVGVEEYRLGVRTVYGEKQEGPEASPP
jgi:hypothetical protein